MMASIRRLLAWRWSFLLFHWENPGPDLARFTMPGLRWARAGTRSNCKLFGKTVYVAYEGHALLNLGLLRYMRVGAVQQARIGCLVFYERVGDLWSIRPYLIKKGARNGNEQAEG
jgi:hypothetical protein